MRKSKKIINKIDKQKKQLRQELIATETYSILTSETSAVEARIQLLFNTLKTIQRAKLEPSYRKIKIQMIENRIKELLQEVSGTIH